jgi:GMP reductase
LYFLHTKRVKYDFNDILIEPAPTSFIDSRSKIDPFYKKFNLPLIAAPMDTVLDEFNYKLFLVYGISVAMPRGLKKMYIPGRLNEMFFNSYSLSEFSNSLEKEEVIPKYILIDMANGHLKNLRDVIMDSKKSRPEIVIMAGNVANPETYRLLSEAGADFVRIGIGNGNGCLTTQQTGIGYPMASLIKECYDVSCTLEKPAKIVADGGMKEYSDIIKALALGADYVMVGSIFNKALESAGDTYFMGVKINQYSKFAEWILNKTDIHLVKKFRGMSSKEVQRLWGKKVIKTSEGIVKKQNVDYTIGQWVENFDHYLRSAMSYTGAETLSDFIGKVKVNQISQQAYKRFNK